MKKRIISFLLVFVLIMSLAACGGNSSQNAGTTSTLASESAAASTNVAGDSQKVDIWAPYTDTVTISTVKSDLSSIIYPDGEDINNNSWTQEYLKRFNIKLENEWVSDDYNTKLNLQIAEGKIPDVFIVSAVQLKQLVDANMLCDLTDVYGQYASELIKNSENADPESYNSGVFNGKLYGLAQLGYGSIAQPDFVWIRQDWLKNTGLNSPKTVDDLKNIAKTFMQKYGGYGIAADKSLEFLNLMAIGWGAHPGMWVRDEGGNIVFGSTTSKMKSALSTWAEWYKEGIISSDFATTDMAKVNEDVINGKVGIMPYYNWWGYAVGADLVSKNGFDAIFHPYNVPSANGERVLQSILCDNSTYVVISKKCKNPEAVMKLINFYAYIASSEAVEKEPDLVKRLTTGELSHTQMTTRVFDPTTLKTEFGSINQACLAGKSDGLAQKYLVSYNNIQKYIKDPKANSAITGNYLQCGFDGSAYTIANKIFDDGDILKNVLWAVVPDTLASKGSTLADILTEGFTKIIIGEQPIDYFDTVVQNWKQSGGDQATKEMMELYK